MCDVEADIFLNQFPNKSYRMWEEKTDLEVNIWTLGPVSCTYLASIPYKIISVDQYCHYYSSAMFMGKQKDLTRIKKPIVSWASSREAWPAGRGRWFCPFTLLSWDPTCSTASDSGAPNTRRTWMCWSGSRGGPRKWSEGWSTSPMRTGWESWGCSAWRREGCGETSLRPPSNWRGLIRKMGTNILVGPIAIGQWVRVLN